MAIPKKQATTNSEITDPTKLSDVHGPNPLDRNGNSTAIESPSKRLFFNGSSYSGADIKVLVHKYHEGPISIIKQLEAAIGSYEQVNSILSNLKANTRLIRPLQDQLVSGQIARTQYELQFNNIWRQPINNIIGIESSLPVNINYNQFIGKTLLGRYFAVQENPTAFAGEIDAIKSDLQLLIDGWKQQKDALDSKKESGQFFQTKVLAELQTISLSTYREKGPVRSFGKSNPQGWVRGQRTIAGSMIFTVFDKNVLFSLLDYDPSDFDGDNKFKAAILDQLPPIDITIQFANEYGSLSRMTIYGVEFVSEGQTMSIEDILLENTVQYIARDVDPMTPVTTEDGRRYSEVLLAYNQALAQGRRPDKPLKASDLIGSDYGEVENDEDASETRFKNRYNPYF